MAEKDSRYSLARDMIAGGFTHSFVQIFEAVPKSVVYRDMGMNYARFKKILAKPDILSLREIMAMARLIGCDPRVLRDIIWEDVYGKNKRTGK